MHLIILAGGRGTRMGDLARDVPKPMVAVAGKPILEHQLDIARRHGLTDVTLLTGHLGEVIEQHFGDGSRLGLRLRYVRETQPLGTAGALKAIEADLREDLVVFYGDTIFDLDLDALMAAHRKHQAVGTLVVHPNDHPHDSDLVEVEDTDRVTAVHRKPHPPGVCYRNLVSAALYVLSPKILAAVHPGVSSDFGRDIFPALAAGNAPLYAYNTPEYLKDVGTPQRLREVEHDIVSGKVARMNRRFARPAIFLDRDGVINRDSMDHIPTPAALELLPRVAQALQRINRSDYLAVCVTNQPMIAKGFASEADLAAVHAKMEHELGAAGAYLDRIYYCPHHPDRGFTGERPELKIECDCRKPGTGMITRAAADMHIDLARSWIIGDRTVDIECGRRAGLRSILVRTGAAGSDKKYECKPEAIVDDLWEAVEMIAGYGVQGLGFGSSHPRAFCWGSTKPPSRVSRTGVSQSLNPSHPNLPFLTPNPEP